ncbi:hypothetical protein TNCV_2679751 [Trichonephila clavipes]|nr:hypothetical protein TNCV_2679751 [Trichonephila clavipes]
MALRVDFSRGKSEKTGAVRTVERQAAARWLAVRVTERIAFDIQIFSAKDCASGNSTYCRDGNGSTSSPIVVDVKGWRVTGCRDRGVSLTIPISLVFAV